VTTRTHFRRHNNLTAALKLYFPAKTFIMKAAVFHKPGDISVDNVDDPKIEKPQDIILRVTSTALCGSDLHIYDGFFPQLKDQIMGHEFMGIVEETGAAVTKLKKGDRVVVPFPIACGQCFFCAHELPGHCEQSNPEHYGPEGDMTKGKGGGLFGYTDLYGGYSGGQAEYVRVPYANFGPRIVPDGLTDEEVLFLTDIFPTGWTAIDWAEVQGGETVVIFGSGPVGLMAQKAAWLRGAKRVIAVDYEQYRLDKAAAVNNVETLNAADDDLIEKIYSTTDGRGADVCVDAVGVEAKRNVGEKLKALINLEKGSAKVMENCFKAVRRGGKVSVVGVYGSTYDNFPVHTLFDKGIRVQFGQAPVQKYIDELFELVRNKKVVLNDIISHRLPLDQASHAYDIFKNKKEDCVKVVLRP
jgi:S-(hydroxymethyl)glutathione dehydrogenase / alcohol dehydrogenase